MHDDAGRDSAVAMFEYAAETPVGQSQYPIAELTTGALGPVRARWTVSRLFFRLEVRLVLSAGRLRWTPKKVSSLWETP